MPPNDPDTPDLSGVDGAPGSASGSSGPSALLRTAAAGGRRDRVALIDGATRLTWAQWDRRVTSAALALIDAGLEPGDRVALRLPTGADLAILYLAALRAGLVAVPVNPAYTGPEVEHVLTDARAALHLDVAGARDLLAGAPSGEDPRRDRGGEATAVLLYTSGTSGRGRGAMLPARALLANLDQLAALGLLRADDTLFSPLPLTHVYGLQAGLGMALRVGATLVLADRFDAGATLATMAGEGVSAVLAVPGQLAAWLAHPALADGFRHVRFAMSGSTTLARGVIEGFAAAGVPVHDGYGLTEAAPVVTVNTTGTASVGRPLPGVELQLRDGPDPADVVDDGDPGRIFLRGPNLFTGYWPDGRDGPDADGWFGTGDVAVLDDDGDLHLVGRSTDLVIVNGFNVYPAEVEAVLAEDADVAEVAVVGVPDERTGEAVRAYVVPVAGAQLDPDALVARAAGSLARFKRPTSVEIVDTLPHTVTGKIMKWQLHGRG